jgi:hypothetical protein
MRKAKRDKTRQRFDRTSRADREDFETMRTKVIA